MQMSTILQIICLVSHMLYYTNKLISNDIHIVVKKVFTKILHVLRVAAGLFQAVSVHECSTVYDNRWQSAAYLFLRRIDK